MQFIFLTGYDFRQKAVFRFEVLLVYIAPWLAADVCAGILNEISVSICRNTSNSAWHVAWFIMANAASSGLMP